MVVRKEEDLFRLIEVHLRKWEQVDGDAQEPFRNFDAGLGDPASDVSEDVLKVRVGTSPRYGLHGFVCGRHRHGDWHV